MDLPIQPLYTDEHGTVRFRANALVRFLLDNGGIDMNKLAVEDFPVEDREQFAQLIGYSLSGFSELSYVRDITYEAAVMMAGTGVTEATARIAALEATLDKVRVAVRDAAVTVFRIHPDDLHD
jgi:hypothetical protein